MVINITKSSSLFSPHTAALPVMVSCTVNRPIDWQLTCALHWGIFLAGPIFNTNHLPPQVFLPHITYSKTQDPLLEEIHWTVIWLLSFFKAFIILLLFLFYICWVMTINILQSFVWSWTIRLNCRTLNQLNLFSHSSAPLHPCYVYY